MSTRCICPICWHAENRRARRNGGEPCHDDADSLEWCPPYGGARGQQVTRWDYGAWVCWICEARFTENDAAMLIDAVLRADPGVDPPADPAAMFPDAERAYRRKPTG